MTHLHTQHPSVHALIRVYASGHRKRGTDRQTEIETDTDRE